MMWIFNDKWKLSVFDNMNFKIGGELRYRISIGGFLNAKKVEIPDYQHFNGNLVYSSKKYLNSFQLASYYRTAIKKLLYRIACRAPFQWLDHKQDPVI